MATSTDTTTQAPAYRLRHGTIPDTHLLDGMTRGDRGWWLEGVDPADCDEHWPAWVDPVYSPDLSAGQPSAETTYSADLNLHNARREATKLIQARHRRATYIVTRWATMAVNYDGATDSWEECEVPTLVMRSHQLEFFVANLGSFCVGYRPDEVLDVLDKLYEPNEVITIRHATEPNCKVHMPVRQILAVHERVSERPVPAPQVPDQHIITA